MDIHHLRIFYEVCKNQSFTRTAEKLYISQSAVSIQIKKLEASLQTQLIERSSKNFKLTYIGQELFKLTEEIFDKFLRVENEMNKLINSKKSKIVIGATHNIGEPVLPKIITEYVKQYPNIEFDIYIKNSNSLIKYLKEGNIDVALMEDDFFEDRTLKFIQSEEYPFVVIAPPDIKDIEDIKNFLKFMREYNINYEFESLINKNK